MLKRTLNSSGKSLPKHLVSIFTAIWLALVMTTLSSQRPIRAKESDSNHDAFYSTLKSPFIGEKEMFNVVVK